jgi:hypothetical protein
MEHTIDEQGQRYVTTTILTCKSYQEPTERTEFLVTSAEVWLTHLLFSGVVDFRGYHLPAIHTPCSQSRWREKKKSTTISE